MKKCLEHAMSNLFDSMDVETVSLESSSRFFMSLKEKDDINLKDENVVLAVRDLSYRYSRSQQDIEVLKKINFCLYRRQSVALIGASGVGKSTFLHVLGLLDPPQSGEIFLRDGAQMVALKGLTDGQRTSLRGHLIGFVYQFHHLLPEFSALENVVIPQLIAKTPFKEAEERGRYLLDLVGLSHRLHHRPSHLSGGQQQRVAIARALANEPEILLADEPTGNLDEKIAQEILDLFFQLCLHQGVSLIMATHNRDLCSRFDTVMALQGGKLILKDSVV